MITVKDIERIILEYEKIRGFLNDDGTLCSSLELAQRIQIYLNEDESNKDETEVSDRTLFKVLNSLHDCPYLTDEQQHLFDYLPYGYMVDEVFDHIRKHMGLYGN